ncbi:MAG: hypothetical protein ACHBN1_06320 [Heteroscytonema crispum UTEX LB 1556]
MAPLPRARSDPQGIFPTADFAPQHPPTNNQQPTTNNPTGEPVAWVGKPYQGRPFTNNQLMTNG